MTPLTATQVRDICRRFEIDPSKALGQNFLIDPNTVRRVVRLSGVGPEDSVIEVGAGMGTMTGELASVARHVTAIELDRRLIEVLTEEFSNVGNVEVVAADAMQVDFSELAGMQSTLVANLPYNISTPLIAKILSEAPAIRSFTIMVQKEAGERLVAAPGSKTYGSISVRVAYHCDAKIIGSVPRSVFWPPPGVDSVLVHMTRRERTADIDEDKLMRVVRAAFSQRRKTLRNALASSLDLDPGDVERAISKAAIDEMSRAESLDLAEFGRLADALEL